MTKIFETLRIFILLVWGNEEFLFQNHVFQKSRENAKKCRLYGATWFLKWVFECKFLFNFWHVPKCLIQNLTRCMNFFQNLGHHKTPNIKSSFSKRHEKCKTLFSRRNIIWKLIFWVETFFQLLTRFMFLN